MHKDVILGSAITVIILGALGAFGYLYLKVDGQADKIATLDKKIGILTTFLNDKMPNANLPALLTMSANKNISPQKAVTAMQLFKNDPDKAKTYLESELHFNKQEIQSVTSPVKN
jgi:hypothetical protein